MTTAKYPNRRKDRKKIELIYELSEDARWVAEFKLRDTIFAVGYERIVYGDHGPYIEFSENHIRCKLFSRFGNDINFNVIPDDPQYYYYWCYPKGHKNVKVYFQLKTVKDLPNAPKREDGEPSRFNRGEGYADYKVGKFYVSPYEFKAEEVHIFN